MPVFRNAEYLFRPKTVAIVGASDTGGGGWPKAIYDNMEQAGFPARVFLINPRRDELWGQKVYPNFAAIPEKIDLALSIVPAEAVPEVLAEGAANGLETALVFAARFGEGGDAEGEVRAQKLRDLCDNDGLRICGPNCMGAISMRENLLFYPASRVRGLPHGPIGVVFQSGGTFQYWLSQGATRGLGFTYAVSSGNELNLDIADYVNFMVEDPDTKLIACMIEGIRRPEAFMAAAEKAFNAGKPIIALKVGTSERGQTATASHTGALAGDSDVFDAMCRKYGIVRCATLDDMIETALAFQAGRIPGGPRVAMAGYSGGAKGLFLDYATVEGLELATLSDDTKEQLAPLLDRGLAPDNPLDTGAGLASQAAKFSEVCRIMTEDPGVDMFSMQGQLPVRADDKADPETFASVARIGKPIISHGRMSQNITPDGRAFQEKTAIPFLQGLPESVRALKALADYGKRRQQGIGPMATPAQSPDLGEAAFNDALIRHGITPPKSAFAATAEDAAAKAAEVGFPVALKIVSPQASHKTEIGGVALNLLDEIAVRSEADAMRDRLSHIDASAEVSGFLVQEMVSGLEVIVGVREDPQFGPFMVLGLGGIYVEALKDVAFRLLPVSEEDAGEMLDELRAKALLGAFRGAKARDRQALMTAAAGLSALYLEYRDALSDLEINPLIVLAEGEGVRAVDVRPVRRTT
jgi:acetate---CoA ligase (ADP-forming)